MTRLQARFVQLATWYARLRGQTHRLRDEHQRTLHEARNVRNVVGLTRSLNKGLRPLGR